MADNYLEKRMDDYRSGRLTPKARTVVKSSPRLAPNQLLLEYPELKIVISPSLSVELIEALVVAYRGIGAKVAFSLHDTRKGTLLAQKHGARFYPSEKFPTVEEILPDAVKQWGRIDVCISSDEDKPSATDIEKNIYVKEGSDAKSVQYIARSVLIQSHPDVLSL